MCWAFVPFLDTCRSACLSRWSVDVQWIVAGVCSVSAAAGTAVYWACRWQELGQWGWPPSRRLHSRGLNPISHWSVSFLPARCYASAGTSYGHVSTYLLSVHPSVSLSQVGVLAKRLGWLFAWELPSTYPTLCYKEIQIHKYFTCTPSSVTRGHPYKLYKAQCENSQRPHFFTEWIVNVWNSLPANVDFSSLPRFQQSVEQVDFSQFLQCVIVAVIPKPYNFFSLFWENSKKLTTKQSLHLRYLYITTTFTAR